MKPSKLLITVTFLLVGGVAAFAAAAGGNQLANAMIEAVKKGLGNLTTTQKNSVVEIVAAWGRYGDGDLRKLVYMLALAYHESRLAPVREIKGAAGSYVWENYQKNYWHTGFFGRGYVQLTHEDNYRRMSSVVGIDLVKNPDAALRPDVAAKILVYGMMNGAFTGKRLADYINAGQTDTYNARRTVGAIMVAGKDTAQMIVEHYNNIANQLSQ